MAFVPVGPSGALASARAISQDGLWSLLSARISENMMRGAQVLSGEENQPPVEESVEEDEVNAGINWLIWANKIAELGALNPDCAKKEIRSMPQSQIEQIEWKEWKEPVGHHREWEI
jgi:hypothetical protein